MKDKFYKGLIPVLIRLPNLPDNQVRLDMVVRYVEEFMEEVDVTDISVNGLEVTLDLKEDFKECLKYVKDSFEYAGYCVDY